MKVAILHHYSLSYGGGGEKMIESIVNELVKRGHKVAVYSLPIRRGHNSEIIYNVKNYHEALFLKVDADVVYVMYAPLIMKLFRAASPKIAGIHSFLPCLSFAHSPIKRGEFVFHHGMLTTLAMIIWKVYGYKELTQYDAIHVPNLSNPLDLTNKRIYCIPNWIDANVFKPRENRRRIFTVTFVGKHIWQKGWDIYQEIVHFLKKKFDDIDFISIGGSITNEKYVNNLGYISSSKQLSEIYSSSHVVVYPSRADIFGLTIIESLACGTPILTSPLPSHAAFLPRHFLCWNLLDYLKKILKFYSRWKKDKSSYGAISENCRKIAMKFDKSRIFPIFEKMLLEVAQEGG